MSNRTTVHVVRQGHPGVLIPANKDRHMVVEYGHVFEGTLVGMVYLHDKPQYDHEFRWMDHDLLPRMGSRVNIETRWPPLMPTITYME